MATNDDLAELETLTDDILCDCLNERYQQDKIYTYVGDILIAVNPFQRFGLYTNEVSAQYCNVHNKSELPPHLFAIADSAYHSMSRNKKSQVCVISGESGAGKTESAKQFIRQIMDVSARGVMGGGAADATHVRAKHPVETKITQQNPILESFGNAKTVMNDNSSRFGKFIELQFGGQGTVVGAEMQHYLLEKARIVAQGPGERNYHIFGMLFAGLDKGQRDLYALTQTSDYKYLPEDCGVASELAEMWEELQQAFDDCGFTTKERDEMYSVLAAILQLGNFNFVEGNEGDAAIIENQDCSELVARGLMVEQDQLEAALLTALLNLRGEIIVKKNNIQKGNNARNATAKSLYDKLFQWLVFKVNLTMRGKVDEVVPNQNVSILDIFGFENFKVNGFDQMCINLANERLHYFFNQHIFAAEMGSYAAEGLEMTSDVMFHDNEVVLNLFFRKPMGLLALLDEESNFPKASAKSLLSKFNKNLKDEELYNEVKGDYAFEVVHYAGAIQYHTDGYLEKNTDPLPDLIPPCFESSKSSLLKMMYSSDWDLAEAVGDQRNRRRSSKGTRKRKTFKAQRSRKTLNKRGDRAQLQSQKSKITMVRDKKKNDISTVSAHFRVSLDQLMEKMGLCDPHFVRCLKPNAAKVPRAWEQKLVLRQLTYTGMLQTVKMRREGFPFRIKFDNFFDTYHGIVFDFLCPMKGNAQTCKELLTKLEALVEARREELGLKTITTKLSGWKVAKSMVFLKYWQADLLDGLIHPFGVNALKIQTQWRMYIARKKFQPMKQKYADECAQAATFIVEISNKASRISNSLETLIEEEIRRGPFDLGIAKPVEVKEAKKMEKEKAKGVVAQVDQKKFAKDLDKVKKGVVKWWIRMERAKGIHLDDEGNLYPWFHGLISRVEAEDYLFDQPSGAFLIRVSERVHGYALSFRHGQRIRHYKLGFSRQGGYEVVGNNEDFTTLAELVDYYQSHAITAGSDDSLGEGVQSDHDLGLGIAQSDDNVGKKPKDRRADREQKTKTMVSIIDTESSGEPLPYSSFLESDDPQPRWLRGVMTRHESEQELSDRGMVDGRFLIREKGRWPKRVVLALSVSYARKFYHHLLTKTVGGEWHLDEKRMDFSDSLEEVIRFLQRKKSPRLATVLEADVPLAPEGVAEIIEPKAQHRASVVPMNNNRSNLVPSMSSTVDDVVAWLASLGLAKYAGAFYKAKFDGKKLHKATEKQLRKVVKNEDDYILMVRALR